MIVRHKFSNIKKDGWANLSYVVPKSLESRTGYLHETTYIYDSESIVRYKLLTYRNSFNI